MRPERLELFSEGRATPGSRGRNLRGESCLPGGNRGRRGRVVLYLFNRTTKLPSFFRRAKNAGKTWHLLCIYWFWVEEVRGWDGRSSVEIRKKIVGLMEGKKWGRICREAEEVLLKCGKRPAGRRIPKYSRSSERKKARIGRNRGILVAIPVEIWNYPGKIGTRSGQTCANLEENRRRSAVKWKIRQRRTAF